MDFNEYQKMIEKFRKYPNVGNNIEYTVLGLAGEAGEIANKTKKIQRDMGGVATQQVKDALADELGDALWYVAALASELGKDLNSVAFANIEKLNGRQARGTIQGSGDNR